MRKQLYITTLILFVSAFAFAQSGLKVGQQAPAFSGIDINSKPVALKELLKKNKYVVLFFYRGQWCPYCNKHLKQLQDSLQTLTAKNAYVLGVTPETDESIKKTIDKTKASFSLVFDKDRQIMKAYDVNYVMEQSMVDKYKGYGVDLEKNNGSTDHMLPVPATYVIDQSGKIIYVHFDKDYRRRAAVSTLASYMN